MDNSALSEVADFASHECSFSSFVRQARLLTLFSTSVASLIPSHLSEMGINHKARIESLSQQNNQKQAG